MKTTPSRRALAPRPLATGIAALLLAAAPLAAQTYTSSSSFSFINPLAWNFGAGAFGPWSIPASDPALALSFQSFGNVTASNDLNLTLNRINLGAYANTLTLAGATGGGYAFVNNGTAAASIQLLGATSNATQLSANTVLGQGLSSLHFDGAGANSVTISGVISSNTSAGAPLIIATDARNALTGGVSLSGTNTFAGGGVVLNSGTLTLGAARALGDRANVLTINGGVLRAAGPVTIGNAVVLNSTLNTLNGSNLLLTGVLSGTGGVTARATSSGAQTQLAGINTYTGATLVGMSNAGGPTVDNAAGLNIQGAVGSILNTSGITVRDGGTLNLVYGSGMSGANTRVSASTAIDLQSGFLQVIGGTGVVRQNVGTVNAGGIATIAALTNSGNVSTGGAATELTIANLVRNAGATALFSGNLLGRNAVAPGLPSGQGNVILTQINGAAPSAGLIGGGGGANSTTISILPWALGELVNSTNLYNGGGFVTIDTHGVRALTGSEFNTSNDLNTAGATENVRIGAAPAALTAPRTVNSLQFTTTSGLTLAGGANTLTITSGALLTNLAATTISVPVNFGAGGAGEGIVTVVGALNSTSNLTLSGGFTAASLVKSGHGDLTISTVNPTIAGGITINGGEIRVDAASRLGGATGITVNGSSQEANRAGLLFTHASGTQTLGTPIAVNAGTVSLSTANAATLQLDSVISGAGGVTYNNANLSGVIVIGGTNTYTGPTFLTGAGFVQIDSDARLGSSADPLASFVNVAGGTLELTGNWTSARAINVSGNSVLSTQTNTATLSGPITGAGTLTKAGVGTLTIDTGTGSTTGLDSSYSGTLVVGAGTLRITNKGALNAAIINLISGSVLDLGGALNIDPTNTGNPWRSITALSGAAGSTIALGTSPAPVDLRVASSGAGVAAVISGFGNLVKTGTGTLTISGGANSFTGGVEVWGGILAATADAAFGNSANTLTLRGGEINFSASTSRGITLGPTPQPIISASAVQVLVNGLNPTSNVTLSGVISGPGGFRTNGGSTLTLSGANTYQGDSQVTGGTLAFSSDANLGSASSRVRLNSGSLRLTVGSGAVTVPRTVILTGTSVVDTQNLGATLDLSGPIMGAAAQTLIKTGGALILSGNSPSFFSTLSIGGAVNPTGNVTLTSTGQLRRANVSLATNSGATFDMSGLTRELGTLSTSTGTTLALGNGGALTTGFNNSPMIWTANVTGDSAASVSKAGTSTLQIASNGNTFGGGFHILSGASGATTVGPAAGTLPLQSALTIGAWGSSANAGPNFTLSNATTNLGTRVADTQVIHSNAGEIQFTTNGSTATSETIGSLRGAGMSTITMTTGGTLNFGDATTGLTRIDRGTFLFRAGNANMGSGAATTALANLTFGNNPGAQLIGGGGGAGTPTISILPYAVGGITTTDTGSNFVTYGANGIRVLNTTTEVSAQTNAASLAGGSSADNVRFANSALTTTQITGGTDLTVNSLSIAGAASQTRLESASTEKLVLESGALLNTVANVWTTTPAAPFARLLGIQTAELQTGAGNTRELNVFTTTGDLALGAKIATSGGLTKSGATNLYLTNTTNTYSGATTINAGSLVVDDLAALGISSTLQMGGGFLKYRGGSGTIAQNIVAAGGETGVNQIGGSAGFDIVSGTTLTAPTGAISGHGGVLKDGTGVLKLTGTNTYSGATIISGGALAIDGAAALGTNGRIIFANGGIPASGGQTLRFDAPGITLTQDFITNSNQVAVAIGFDTNGNNATLTGTLLDARGSAAVRGLYKFGAGDLTLTATQMFVGATQVFGGSLTLAGANGSLLNSTGTSGFFTGSTVLVGPRSTLVLDNTTANNHNRLPDVWDTPFGTGNAASGSVRVANGDFKIIGHAAGTQEKINQFIISFGNVTLQGGGTQLVSGAFQNTSVVSSGLIRGTNLGGTPGATSTNWFLTDLGGGSFVTGNAPLFGAGGAEGTPFVNIVRGFMADTSATGVGTDLVTYAADVGFRPLTASEYTTSIPAGNYDLNRAPNIALTGAAAIGETTTINALKLGSGASLGGSGTAVISGSTILATGNASISTPALGANVAGAPAALSFLTPGSGATLTVDSALISGRFSKVGDGALLLNGRHVGGNFVVLAEGTLQLGANGALNPLIPLINAGSGTFDLGGADRIIGDLPDDGNITAATFYSGQRAGGTVLLGANRLTLYSGATTTFTGEITGTGGLTKAFTSTAITTYAQPLAYTGSTVIRAGTLQLASAGTLASSSIEIRGGTLTFNNTDDNAAAGGYIANRIGTSTPITWAGGGITFTENVNTPANHNLGTTTIAGGNALSIANNSATAPSTTTFANLIRGSTDRGTLTIAATNLGLAQSPAGNARVFATQINGGAPTAALVGAGGTIGSTTQSILPWGFTSTNNFLTYGADGFRPLATSEYAATLGANATDNVRTASAVTLSAPTTANSLSHTNGNITGAFDLTLTSGALAVQAATATIGATTNTLLTGAGNTRELVLFNLGLTTLNYGVTTSGGLTKFGSAILTLAGTNTFGGGLTINEGTVRFNADTRLGAAGGAIRFGGTASAPATLEFTVAGGALDFNRPVETLSFGNFTGAANLRWRFNQPITGAGGVRFTTTGAVFELNAANTYAGPTHLSSGIVHIHNDASLGSGGEVIFGGGVLVTRGDWTSNRLVHIANTSLLVSDRADTTWSGQLIGVAALGKIGARDLTLTEAMPYSGTLTHSAGALVLKDRGSLAVSTITAAAGASLILDDTAAHFSDRLNDLGTLTLAGGSLTIKGSASTTTEEVINALALNTGANTVTITPGAAQAAILRLATNATSAAGAATLFRGTNLGVNTPGTANSASIVLTHLASQNQVNSINTGVVLTGGLAPAGHPSIGIIKGGFGDLSATGSGAALVTYDMEKGVRLLDETTEFTTTWLDGAIVTDNVKADNAAFNFVAPTTGNSLWLKNGGNVSGAGAVTLTSGTLLVTGAGNSIANPITAGGNAFVVGGPGDVNFTGALTGGGGFIKMGAGTTTLSVSNTYTGNTVLADGAVAVGHANAFNNTAVQFQGGEIRNATAGLLTLTNALTLNGQMRIGGTQPLTFGGTVSLNNATREIRSDNTATTTFNGVISPNVLNVGYGLTKSGPGQITLSGAAANTFDGPTTITGGTLETAKAGALSATESVTVNSGGTLLLSSTANQVSNDAPVTLAGGALRGNANTLNEDLGTLTLSANSVIDFGAFASGLQLRFDDSSALSWTGTTLSIWNWTAGLDRLYIGLNPSGLLANQLSKINFYTDSGATLAGPLGGAYNTMAPFDGANGEVSVTPIPEPGAIFVATSLLGLIGWRERRREQQRLRIGRARR